MTSYRKHLGILFIALCAILLPTLVTRDTAAADNASIEDVVTTNMLY